METDRTIVLLVSADTIDAGLVRRALTADTGTHWHLRRLRRLSHAIARLQQHKVAAVLLDLSLPDSRGIETFEALFEVAQLVPILILADPENEDIALQATRQGAQDYLLKEHLNAYWLPRLLRSVIERKAVEDALFLEKERAQVTLNSIGDAVLSTNIAGNVTYLNKVAEDMTGWSSQEAVGRPLAEVFQIVNGTTREPAPNPMTQAVQENRTVGLSANCILIRRDGVESNIEDSAAPIRDRGGTVIGAVIVFHDISMARSVVQQMAHLAQHDILTGLPNRLLFGDRLAHTIVLDHRHGRQCAVLYIDLDNFKDINDARGHSLGDQILQAIAKRLLTCVRGSDTVCRQGGDEFVILLSEISRPEDAARSAEKLLAALAKPYNVAGEIFHVSASIGISLYPGDATHAEALVRNADSAMFHAKHEGGNTYHFFRDDTRVLAR
ncbi:MAG: diguanylate cyclase [Gammaproteobacteria bacterium]|nr:diguanylate cyclase [Gammaproteobacteria bacterium]